MQEPSTLDLALVVGFVIIGGVAVTTTLVLTALIKHANRKEK